MNNSDTPQQEINKATIDTSPAGSIMFYSERPDRIASAAFSPAFDKILSLLANSGATLNLSPLRLVWFSPDLSVPVKWWQRQLELPEAGVSDQPEGVVGGKTISWGSDAASARTIVLLYDALAFAATLSEPAALSTVAHELAHVSDYFLRSLAFGFPSSDLPPALHDWPSIRRSIAESVWSEYAAESVAFVFMDDKSLEECRKNDVLYLAGIDGRIRASAMNYKLGQLGMGPFWSRSVTDIYNNFSNLGRAAARLPLGSDEQNESKRLAGNNGAAAWGPVIEKLFAELRMLAAKDYKDWPASPFGGIEEAVELGFEALGLFPIYDGFNLRVIAQ